MSEDQILKKRTSQGRLGTNPTIRQDDAVEDASSPNSPGRREFMSNIGMMTTATLAASVLGLSSVLEGCSEPVHGQDVSCEIGPLTGSQRVDAAFRVRHDAASLERALPVPDHPCNGDEELYPNKIGSYSKGLPHNNLGEVDLDAYDALINALSSGNPDDFESVPITGDIKLKNPQSGLAFELIGADSHHLGMPPAPTFNSAEEAAEIAELYWMALARDVHFSDYESNQVTNDAAEDLSTFSDFQGPTVGGQVTTRTLFRADIPGVLVGPFLSQFLVKTIPAGPMVLEQRIRTLLPVDYIVSYNEWLSVQDGHLPANALSSDVYDPIHRFLRDGRDLAENQHWDWPAQAAVNALLIIFGLEGKSPAEIFLANTGVPYNSGNPYLASQTQAGFVTFHIVDIVRRVVEAMNSALKAAWYQKWFVHRRLRPEGFGGRIHNDLMGLADYPINEEILNSPVLDVVFDANGTFLLPQAFPEGAPCHPAYPSGHATWAGAAVTMLKAFFNESTIISDPLVASPDGLSLLPYNGPGFDQLTIGGELNKLAWNIAMGRNFAGIHWRTDAMEGLKLGEAVAIRIMQDLLNTYDEDFGGFTFTKFDGTTVTV
jgi:membrane-associated phospholipid phosphatase